MRIIDQLAEHYDFKSSHDLFLSLFPSIKLELLNVMFVTGFAATIADKVLGVDFLAIGALLVMMATELLTGIWASFIRKEDFSSKRLSRFGIKVACYLLLMAVPYLFYVSYHNRGNTMAASVFEWVHVFLVIHIVQEYMVSILENLACIQGKPKTYWIDKIKEKIGSTFKIN